MSRTGTRGRRDGRHAPWEAARAIARVADPSEERLALFLRGLVVGSFVGAAIAGSTIWRGVRARRAREGRAGR